MLKKKRNVISNDVNKRWMMFSDYICYSKFTLKVIVGIVAKQILYVSPWAKTQIFTYRYHLGGQNLVMFFMYTYAQCII